jgi:hypothetical protein
VYHSAFGMQINNYMISETSKGNQTIFSLQPTKKLDTLIFKNLLSKIQAKQKEPFAEIYIHLHPMFFAVLLTALKNKDIEIKNISSDNQNIFIKI